VLAEAGEIGPLAISFAQGIVELEGPAGTGELGKFMGTKKFDPRGLRGPSSSSCRARSASSAAASRPWRSVNASFKEPAPSTDLARKYKAAIVYAHDEDFPENRRADRQTSTYGPP